MSTRHHLEAIPELAAEAFATRGTRPVSDDGDRRRAHPGSRTLADLDRLLAFDPHPPRQASPRHHEDGDQRHASIGSLFGWVRVHHDDELEEGIDTWWPADDVASVCTWLGVRLAWAERQEWADEYADDVRLLWGQLRAICRIRKAASWTCATPDCGQRMDLMGDVFRCTEGHEHPGPERVIARYWRRPSLPTADICAEFGVTEADLHNWQRRRGLAPDRAKGRRPLHWWPRDVLLAQRPYLRTLVAELAEDSA